MFRLAFNIIAATLVGSVFGGGLAVSRKNIEKDIMKVSFGLLEETALINSKAISLKERVAQSEMTDASKGIFNAILDRKEMCTISFLEDIEKFVADCPKRWSAHNCMQKEKLEFLWMILRGFQENDNMSPEQAFECTQAVAHEVGVTMAMVTNYADEKIKAA